MLILEGAALLGKTEAALRLITICGEAFPVRHSVLVKPPKAFDFFHHYKDSISAYAIQEYFHLSGLVWHENRISLPRLRVIESWLGLFGSYTIVFFAENDEWYRALLHEKLEKMNLVVKHMDSIDRNIQANAEFREMAYGMHCFQPRVDSYIGLGEENEYTGDPILTLWAQEWADRLAVIDATEEEEEESI